MLSNYSRSWTACAVMISSFIHSKVVVTRVKSLENDRQGRSRREYCVQETAVWPKMFNVNRERRHGQRLLLYLARLFKFRSRPHRSACAFHSTFDRMQSFPTAEPKRCTRDMCQEFVTCSVSPIRLVMGYHQERGRAASVSEKTPPRVHARAQFPMPAAKSVPSGAHSGQNAQVS